MRSYYLLVPITLAAIYLLNGLIHVRWGFNYDDIPIFVVLYLGLVALKLWKEALEV